MTAKKQLLSYALCKTKWKPEIFVVQSPDAHVVSCNRGGVERRHAAWDAREPGGDVRAPVSGNPGRSGHYLTVRR